MVRRFKVPGFAKSSFSANELSGWADGITYDVYVPAHMKDLKQIATDKREKSRERQRNNQPTPIVPIKAVPIEGLIGLGDDSILL